MKEKKYWRQTLTIVLRDLEFVLRDLDFDLQDLDLGSKGRLAIGVVDVPWRWWMVGGRELGVDVGIDRCLSVCVRLPGATCSWRWWWGRGLEWECTLVSLQRCGTGRVSTAKSGGDPDWAILRRTRLTLLLRWGTESPERVPASSEYHEKVWETLPMKRHWSTVRSVTHT